jgi:hypothetical protein
MATAIDAKGDLIAGTGADAFARIGVGANGTVLTAASGETTGLSWAAPVTGGMTLLSTTTLSGTSTTVSSIDQTYKNLIIIINNPFVNTGSQTLRIRPNSTSGIGLSQGVQLSTATTFSNIDGSGNGLPTATSNGTFQLDITNYSQTTYSKNFQWSGGDTNQNSAVNFAGFINTTSAITSIEVTTVNGTATFSGGTVLIYGVK